MCFCGIILIIKPDFLFGKTNDWPLLFLILPIVVALFSAIAMHMLHSLKGKVTTQISLQYFYIAQIFLTGLIQNFAPISLPETVPLEFFLGMAALVGCAYLTQNLMTRAVYLKKASLIMPFGYAGIVFASIYDILSGEHFDFLSIVGMVLTSAGLMSKLLIKE